MHLQAIMALTMAAGPYDNDAAAALALAAAARPAASDHAARYAAAYGRAKAERRPFVVFVGWACQPCVQATPEAVHFHCESAAGWGWSGPGVAVFRPLADGTFSGTALPAGCSSWQVRMAATGGTPGAVPAPVAASFFAPPPMFGGGFRGPMMGGASPCGPGGCR